MVINGSRVDKILIKFFTRMFQLIFLIFSLNRQINTFASFRTPGESPLFAIYTAHNRHRP